MTPEIIYLFYAADRMGATLNLVVPPVQCGGIHDYITEVNSRILVCLNVTYDRCVRPPSAPIWKGAGALPGQLSAYAAAAGL